jgi:heme o synthase
MSLESSKETLSPLDADARAGVRANGQVHGNGHVNGNGAAIAVPRPLRAPRRRGETLALLRDYVALTKPRIISLLLLTTVAAMFVADPSGPPVATILWTMLGGYLAAGGAGAINHYLDRERDARMTRTRKRPLPSGRIPPSHALAFGIALGALAVVQLALTVNVLAAALSLAGLLGYVFVYTAWLKPLTPQNIVIGGAAGAVPPLVGWAAATGALSLDALWLFGIVFLWTPPHFWALALLISDDYERTGVPMLPVVRGAEATRRQILGYAVVLVVATLLPVATGLFGASYAVAAAALGAGFVGLAWALLRDPSRRAALRLYLSSLAYLALLFCAMALDRVLGA